MDGIMNTSNMRAWGHREDRDNYEMFYDFSSFDEYFCPWNDGFAICDHTLMRYTTLNDKDEKPVFEGDIVRILYTDWCSQSPEKNGRYSMSLEDYKDSISNVGKIVFLDCKFCIQFNVDGYANSIHCGTHGQIKVIGNVHENPGLIGDL